jgi:hypothetical protein
MADLKKYFPWALILGATSAPFENLQLGNDNLRSAVRSDGTLYPQLDQIFQKKVMISGTCLDPSLITEWQAVESGETYTQVSAHWRAISEEDGPAGAYFSAAIAKGVLFPVSLNAPFDDIAKVEFMCLGRFDAGTAVTLGTASAAQSELNKAYRPSSLVIGSDTVLRIMSASASWNYNLVQEEMFEPDHYGYDAIDLTGTAELPDLSLVDIARLQDMNEETVTLTLTDINNGTNTIAISFGNCSVVANVSGRSATFNWTKLVS